MLNNEKAPINTDGSLEVRSSAERDGTRLLVTLGDDDELITHARGRGVGDRTVDRTAVARGLTVAADGLREAGHGLPILYLGWEVLVDVTIRYLDINNFISEVFRTKIAGG
ncbi:MAG: hypothetical protein ACTH2Q_07440 [Propionibacteriaceae bacterium]